MVCESRNAGLPAELSCQLPGRAAQQAGWWGQGVSSQQATLWPEGWGLNELKDPKWLQRGVCENVKNLKIF